MLIVNEPAHPLVIIPGDVVGYIGEDNFVILNPMTNRERAFPPRMSSDVATCVFKCVINDKQVIVFNGGKVATLSNLKGKWHYSLHGMKAGVARLEPNTFFEIGDNK